MFSTRRGPQRGPEMGSVTSPTGPALENAMSFGMSSPSITAPGGAFGEFLRTKTRGKSRPNVDDVMVKSREDRRNLTAKS